MGASSVGRRGERPRSGGSAWPRPTTWLPGMYEAGAAIPGRHDRRGAANRDRQRRRRLVRQRLRVPGRRTGSPGSGFKFDARAGGTAKRTPGSWRRPGRQRARPWLKTAEGRGPPRGARRWSRRKGEWIERSSRASCRVPEEKWMMACGFAPGHGCREDTGDQRPPPCCCPTSWPCRSASWTSAKADRDRPRLETSGRRDWARAEAPPASRGPRATSAWRVRQ